MCPNGFLWVVAVTPWKSPGSLSSFIPLLMCNTVARFSPNHSGDFLPAQVSAEVSSRPLVELLSRDSAERKALMSLLGTRVDLEHRAQRWAETHRTPQRVEQLRLWEGDVGGQ